MLNPFHISNLLSESLGGEHAALVLERKRIDRYGDEQNWRGVSPDRLEAGVEK